MAMKKRLAQAALFLRPCITPALRGALLAVLLILVPTMRAQQIDDPQSAADPTANSPTQKWNIHGQITETPQGDPPFPALYSGPNSLGNHGEIQETFTADLYAGARLWHGGEIHVDGLLWQGFGLSNDKGIEAFPNGDAFKLGTKTPISCLPTCLSVQTIGFGGEREQVPDGPLTLAGEQDISRLTFTLGRFSSHGHVRQQRVRSGLGILSFMNWAMITNLAWDFPADSVGYTTGLAVELNQSKWALRYGFFQAPFMQNGFTADDQILTFPHMGADGEFLHSWGMVTEFERRYGDAHPGTIRFLAFLNSADMISFRQAIPLLQANGPGADLSSAQAYRYKSGFGLNWQQKITDDVGVFSRFSWNDGQTEGWMYNDSNWAVSLGTSVKGAAWRRTNDALGLGYVRSGISRSAQEFLELGGTDILDGDGGLTYGSENVVEAYYNLGIWRELSRDSGL